jgi:hypothetical protein
LPALWVAATMRAPAGSESGIVHKSRGGLSGASRRRPGRYGQPEIKHRL